MRREKRLINSLFHLLFDVSQDYTNFKTILMQCSTKSLLPPSLSSKSNPTSISILIILQTHNFFLLLSKDLLYIKNYPSSTDFKVINKLFFGVWAVHIAVIIKVAYFSIVFITLCISLLFWLCCFVVLFANISCFNVGKIYSIFNKNRRRRRKMGNLANWKCVFVCRVK